MTDFIYFENSVFLPLTLSIVSVVYWLYRSSSLHASHTNIPFASKKASWEPRLSANFRFFWNAKMVIDEGYHHLQSKAFKFMRTDGDIIVLPPAYLDELQSLPRDVANATDGNMHNLLGSLTGLDLLLDTDLHFRIIRKRLTRNLNPAMTAIKEELSHISVQDFPAYGTGWVGINVYQALLKTVAQTSARTFVGKNFCRNSEWLEIVTEYTENLFRLVVFTRIFPKWSFPLFATVLPYYWRVQAYIQKAQRILAPTIERRLRSVDLNVYEDDFPEEKDLLLSYMVQEARGIERDPQRLSQLQVILALASIHTVQMSIVHLLYDLVSHPDCLEMLRDEIISTYRDNKCWNRQCYNNLGKLDSVMRESQRLNPPQFLSFHRIMRQDFVLSDGTKLPNGSHVCMATQAIQNDPATTPDPTNFNPLRYYKLRQRPGEEYLHQFANADRTALNFGYGKNSCPGRFFASLEIKIIVTKLLMDFDLKLIPGQQRPRNTTVHEFIVPDMTAKILFKRRRSTVSEDEPF